MTTSQQLKADYCNNKTLTLYVLENFNRKTVETIKVSGKREARKVAEARGAKCWNF